MKVDKKVRKVMRLARKETLCVGSWVSSDAEKIATYSKGRRIIEIHLYKGIYFVTVTKTLRSNPAVFVSDDRVKALEFVMKEYGIVPDVAVA